MLPLVMILFSVIPPCRCIPAPNDPFTKDVIPPAMGSIPTEEDTFPVKVELIRAELEEHPEVQKTRVKRSPKTPAHLAEIFNKAYNDPNLGLTGEVIYMAKRVCHADFKLKKAMFNEKQILKAELSVYKKPLKKTRSLKRRATLHAIVSVHQVFGKFGSTKLVDSRLVRVDTSGWIIFDVTSALNKWLRCKRCNKGLDIWVESLKTGRRAAKIAKRFKFICSKAKHIDHVPSLSIFFADDENSE